MSRRSSHFFARRSVSRPGTSSATGISLGALLPWRSTAALVRTSAFSFSAAWLERNSCQKRRMVLSKIIAASTMIVSYERSSGTARMTSANKEMPAMNARMPLKGVTKACRNCTYQVGGFSCATSFLPYCSRRRSTSCKPNPVSAVFSNASAASLPRCDASIKRGEIRTSRAFFALLVLAAAAVPGAIMVSVMCQFSSDPLRRSNQQQTACS